MDKHFNKPVGDTGEYQGWANWETWNVNLWLNNDEDLYQCFKSVHTAMELYNWFSEMQSDNKKEKNNSPFAQDLAKIDLHLVDWGQIIKVADCDKTWRSAIVKN